MIKQQTMAEEQKGIISYDPATTNMVLDRMYQNRNAFPFDTEAKPESEKGITSGAVYGALAELRGATTLNKGYWNDINSLMAGVPTAEEGSIAYVGEEAPYAVYRYGASGWADTGKTYTPEISPGSFYTKEEVDGKYNKLAETKQDTLTAGENVHIDPETNTISAEGVKVMQETGESRSATMSQKSISDSLASLGGRIDAQKQEVDAAKDAAIEAINGEKQEAIADFSSQRVTPEMLSESTKQLISTAGGGTITNLADDEDIESVGSDDSKVLKLKSRKYSPDGGKGLGYKILRRGTPIREQITDINTVYDIRYDFDISEEGESGYIDFNDPEVRRICIENFSSDGIGVTKEDAAGVSSLNGVFNANTLIETFYELRYFIGLTSIPPYQFSSMGSKFKAVALPEAITSIGNYAFRNNNTAFSILLYSTAPPALSFASLNGASKASFYVPDESLEAYKSAEVWSSVSARIHPMSEYADKAADGLKTLEMPAGCILSFSGGSLYNGLLKGNETVISSELYRIFGDNLSIEGSFKNKAGHPEWFGAESTSESGTYSSGDTMSLAPAVDGLSDAADPINRTLSKFSVAELAGDRTYKIGSTIKVPPGKTLVVPNTTILAAYMNGNGLTIKTVNKEDSTFSEDTVLETPAEVLAENQFIATESMGNAIAISSRSEIKGGGTLFLGKSSFTIGILVEGWAYSYLDMTFAPHVNLRIVGGRKATCYVPDVRDIIGTTVPEASTGEDGQYYYDKLTYSYYHKENNEWVKQSPDYNPPNQFNTSIRIDVPNGTRVINPYIEVWDMYGFRGMEIVTYGDGWFNESIIKGTISNKHGGFISIFAGGGGVSIHHWQDITIQVDKNMQHDCRIFFASKCNLITAGMVWDLAWMSPPRVQVAFELCEKAQNVEMSNSVDSVSYVVDNGKNNVYTRNPKYTEERAIIPMMFENLLNGMSLWFEDMLCRNGMWCMTLDGPKTLEEIMAEDYSSFNGLYPSKYMFDGDNTTYARVIDTASGLYSTSFPINSDNPSSQIKTVRNQCWLEIDYKPSTNIGNTCFAAIEGYNTVTDVKPLKAYSISGTWGNEMTYKMFMRIMGGPSRQHPIIHFYCLDGTNDVTVDIVGMKLWLDGSDISFDRKRNKGSEAERPDSPSKGTIYFNTDTNILEVNAGDAEKPDWIDTAYSKMSKFTEIAIISDSPVIRLKSSEFYKCGTVNSIAIMPDRNTEVLGFVEFTTNESGTTKIIYANSLKYKNVELKGTTTYLVQVSDNTAVINELVSKEAPDDAIIFEDEYCEYVCATKWGSGGFITMHQAASVETLTPLNAGEITSFDELQHFIGVTAVPDNYFQGYKLQKVTFPENVTSIGNHVFRWSSIERLVCNARTPPTLGASQQMFPHAIYVPDDNVDSYKEAPIWSVYASYIKGISQLEETAG